MFPGKDSSFQRLFLLYTSLGIPQKHKQKLYCHCILQRSNSEENQVWNYSLLGPG